MPAAGDSDRYVRINRRELTRKLALRGKTMWDLRAVVSAGTRAKISRGEKVKVRVLAAITGQLAKWPVLLEADDLLLAEEVAG